MTTLVSSLKQQLRKNMQHSVLWLKEHLVGSTKVFLWKMSVIYCDSAIQLSLTMFARHSKWSVTFFSILIILWKSFLITSFTNVQRTKHHVKVSYIILALGWLWATARPWVTRLLAARTFQIHDFELGPSNLRYANWAILFFQCWLSCESNFSLLHLPTYSGQNIMLRFLILS